MDKLPNLKEEDVEKTIKVPEHSGTRVPEKSQAASLRLRSWEHDPRGLRPGDSRTNVHHGMPWKAMESHGKPWKDANRFNCFETMC